MASESAATSDAFIHDYAVKALWASLQLIAAAASGLWAVRVCDWAQQSSIELLRLQSAGKDWKELLRQMPESVSRAIHLTNSPHGTVFKALMLISALLLLNSDFPKHDLYSALKGMQSWGFFWSLYCSFRGICPTIGITMEIFIPVSQQSVQMLEKFKKPGYEITEDDKHVFLATRLQQNMHVAAGIISFALVPAVEGVALGYALICFFSTAQDDMVHWEDKSLASNLWLVIACFRILTILTNDVCMAIMTYETWFEPTSRFIHNPYYVYVPERHAVHALFSYVMLTGLSIWFVSREVWKSMDIGAKVFSVSVTVVALLLTLVWMAQVFLAMCKKTKYLTGNRQRNIVSRIVEEQQVRMSSNSEPMQELEALRKRYEDASLAGGHDLDSDSDSSCEEHRLDCHLENYLL